MDNPEKLHPTVLDTGAEQLGKVYARALISAADRVKAADQVVDELGSFVDDALRSNPALATALASPRISEEEKCRVIDRLLGGKAHPVLVNFLKVMGRRGRLGYVAAVRDAADSLRDEMLGRMVAEVRTAVPLGDDLRASVVKKIGGSTGKEIRLVEVVDPDLVGGMVIRLGDTIFDGSVSNQISKLARQVKSGFSRELVEKFSTFSSG
jgi:F-type H+-transporting ATPase subunit delta